MVTRLPALRDSLVCEWRHIRNFHGYHFAVFTRQPVLWVTSQQKFPLFPWLPGCRPYKTAWFVSDVTTVVSMVSRLPALRDSLVCEWRHNRSFRGYPVAIVTSQLNVRVTSQLQFSWFPWLRGCRGYDKAWFVSDVTIRGSVFTVQPDKRRSELPSECYFHPVKWLGYCWDYFFLL